MTALLHTADALRTRTRAGRRAVVMTMGALHEGHATLIRTARRIAGDEGEVVVTVFVNPSSSARARTSTAIRAPWTPTSRSPNMRARTSCSPPP